MSKSVIPKVFLETPPPDPPVLPLSYILHAPFLTHCVVSLHPLHVLHTDGSDPVTNPAHTALKTVLGVSAPLKGAELTNMVGNTTTPLLPAASISRSKSALGPSSVNPPEESMHWSIIFLSILASH